MNKPAEAAPKKTKEQVAAELFRLKKIKEIQDEINSLKALLEWRKKNWSIKYYAVRRDPVTQKFVSFGPHKQQALFHADPKLIRVASGGNRSGKSTSGISEDVAHALGYRPWLPEGDPNRLIPIRVPNKGLICGESFGEQVAKVLVPKLIGDPEKGVPGAIPTDLLGGTKRNPAGVVTTITLTNGSVIYLQSYDQDVDLFESADYDWCVEGSQRVLMADGTWRPIRDVVPGESVVTVADNGRRKIGVVHAVHRNGVKPVLKIRTRNGHSIRCTANHRLWVPGKGWIEAGDMRPGMSLYRPVRLNTRKRQQIWTVSSVERDGDGEVFDLTVDSEHSYICQGFRVHNCHFDEPPPRPIWVAVQRGLTDRRGRTWLTMTPLKEPWLYDEIYSRKDVGLYYFDIEDNVGFGLTREGVDQFASNLTEDEKEARLRGRFFHLSGLVYKDYQPKLRLKRFPIPAHWGLWFHVDTHPRTPHHAVWIAVAPNGKKYVVGALKNSDTANRVVPFIEAVKVYEKTMFNRRLDEIVRLIEPGAQAPDPLHDGRSIWDEFADHGLRCRPGSKNRDAAILLFQKELQSDPKYGIEPNIFFFEDLEGVHFEMMHYIWDDWAKKAGEGKTEKQEPKKRHDHFIEGIHRILLDEPFCDPAGEEHEVTPGHVDWGRGAINGVNSVTGY